MERRTIGAIRLYMSAKTRLLLWWNAEKIVSAATGAMKKSAIMAFG
jgi:hypothetical protein